MSLDCPSQDEILENMLALLPRGDAFQSNDATVDQTTSVMQAFWAGVSGPMFTLSNAICATYDEFFSFTADEDLDLWQEEYGLPDDCDPFGGNLVAKVQTQGGTSIEYYEERALALGWDTEMRFLKGDDPEFPGVTSTLHVVIKTATSPAALVPVTHFSNWVLGTSPLGEPSTTSLICALDKIIPAHVAITSEVQ